MNARVKAWPSFSLANQRASLECVNVTYAFSVQNMSQARTCDIMSTISKHLFTSMTIITFCPLQSVTFNVSFSDHTHKHQGMKH